MGGLRLALPPLWASVSPPGAVREDDPNVPAKLSFKK